MSFFHCSLKSAASEPNLSVCSPKKSFRDSETMSRELSLTGLLLIGVWVLLDVLIFRWCAHFYCFESNCTVWTQEDRKKINVFIVIWMSRWEDRFLWLPYTAWSRWWRHTTALAKQRAFHCSVGCLSATLKMLEKSFGVVVSRTTSDKTTEFVIWKLLKLEDTTWGNLTFITNELTWSITLICFILHVRPSRVFKRSCIPKHSFSSLAWKWDRTWLNKVENTFDQSLVGVFKVEIMRVKFLTNEIHPVH